MGYDASYRWYVGCAEMSQSMLLCGVCVGRGVLQGTRMFKLTRHYTRPATMRAWQAFGFGGADQLTLSTTAVIPALAKPSDVLVEVYAASINPMDTDMLAGYGSKTFSKVQRLSGSASEFPITFGRDFSGVVVDTGRGVSARHFKPGDEVWGVTSPLLRSTGSHAEYVVASTSEITRKPSTLSHVDAASFPYVVCTAWSAIASTGGVTESNAAQKRVLVLGASGGVGTLAVQLLKAWGASVTGTCASDAIETVLGLGADLAIDYKTNNVKNELEKIARFDLILDCVKVKPEPLSVWMNLLKPNCGTSYVTLNSPLLKNNDSIGFPFGFVKSALDFGPDALKYKTQGKNLGWGLFLPSTSALKHVAALIDKQKVRPLVERVYTFEEVPEGFRQVAKRQGRGKSVISVTS